MTRSAATSSGNRAGMTLVEVIAAIAIAGFVVLGSVLLLDGANDAAARISRDGSALTREGTGARMLRRALRDAEPSADSTKRFRGEERSIEYMTRCPRPEGWSVRCRLILAIDSIGDSSVVVAQLENGDQLALRRLAGAGRFRYFDYSARDTLWVKKWDTNATLPSAVGLLIGGDTIVFPVGASRE